MRTVTDGTLRRVARFDGRRLWTEEKELLDMSMKESFRQRDERIEKEKTYSEEMQDKIEPIDDSYVNKILKGSGWNILF